MSFERQDTYNKVATIIAQQLKIKPEDIHEDSTIESLGADSLDRVEIIMTLEEQFSIEINDEDAEKLSTIRQAVDYVHGLRKK